MFNEKDIQMLDKSYFNIVLTGEYDVTVQSKNTGHFWYILNLEIPGEDACVIFHKRKQWQNWSGEISSMYVRETGHYK